MKPEGWAIYEDGTIAYVGFAAELGHFYDGHIKIKWSNVKMAATGTVVGVGIVSGHWKCAGYLDRPYPVVKVPGSLLTLDIDLTIPEAPLPTGPLALPPAITGMLP